MCTVTRTWHCVVCVSGIRGENVRSQVITVVNVKNVGYNAERFHTYA